MADTKKQTTIILIAVAVVLIVWDIIVVFNNVEGDTESAIIWEATKAGATSLPFLFGALCTHFFWPTQRRILPHAVWVIAIGLVLAAGYNALTYFVFENPEWGSPGGLILGAIYGKIFWWNRGNDGQ